MSRILLPPWRTQPQIAAPIDRGAPISRGLVLLAPLGPGDGYRDLITGRQGTATGLTGRSGTTRGVYPTFSANDYLDLTLPGGVSGTTPITIAFTYRQTAQTDAFPVALAWKPTGATNQFLITIGGSSAGYYFAVGPRDGASSGSEFGSAPPPLNVDRACLLTISSGTDSTSTASRRLWINGVNQPFQLGTSYSGDTGAGFRLGKNYTLSNYFEGSIGNFHIWNRVLTDNEAQAWTTNPFITRQPLRRFWMASAAGGGAITGTSDIVITPTGTLTGAGALAGTADEAFSNSGTLTGAGALAGSADTTITPTGTLTGAGALAGAAAVAFDCAGALTGSSAGSIAGAADLAFGATGTLAGAGALEGMASMIFGADLTSAEAETTTRRNFGGIARPQVIGPKRRNYIVKGQRYFNLTIEELAAVVEQVTAKRKEVKVQVPNQKPKTVDAVTWQEVKPQAAPMFDDDEDVLLLL